MANIPWTCACGRKVPWSVATCRCGKPRPEPGATLAGGAETLAKLPRQESGAGWSWLPKLLGVLALVGLYFGSRMALKYHASRQARTAAVQALGQVVGERTARAAVGPHHDACFEQYYKTGWARRQSSSFETDKYAKCVIDKVMPDLERERSALQRAAAAAPPSRTTPEPAPVAMPTAEVPLRGVWGQATLEDVKVTEWQRDPQLKLSAEFVLVGSQLTQRSQCLLQVNCQGQPPGKTVGIGCVLRGDGERATGSVRYYSEVPGPPSASCELSLQLTDGTTTRSNTVVVPLS